MGGVCGQAGRGASSPPCCFLSRPSRRALAPPSCRPPDRRRQPRALAPAGRRRSRGAQAGLPATLGGRGVLRASVGGRGRRRPVGRLRDRSRRCVCGAGASRVGGRQCVLHAAVGAPETHHGRGQASGREGLRGGAVRTGAWVRRQSSGRWEGRSVVPALWGERLGCCSDSPLKYDARAVAPFAGGSPTVKHFWQRSLASRCWALAWWRSCRSCLRITSVARGRAGHPRRLARRRRCSRPRRPGCGGARSRGSWDASPTLTTFST